MPRLRSDITGVVVNVSEEKAVRLLSAGFSRMEEQKPRRRRASKAAEPKPE